MSEATIERAVCAFAKQYGCLVLKLAGPNQKGQPDRMFLRDGKVLFVEFKAPGKKPTALQMKWMSDLFCNNFPAFVCDDINEGKQLIEEFLL